VSGSKVRYAVLRELLAIDVRMMKKPVQQDRSKREAESYFAPYVEALSDARTPLEGFCNILRL